MTKKMYQKGIEWIACNDEPTEMEIDVVKSQITVCLLADLSGKFPSTVAIDIVNIRRHQGVTHG